MTGPLVINEIYLSLQGESTFAGLPCIFVRLTACNLRCSYCDTAYAFSEGKKMSLSEVRAEIIQLAEPFVCRAEKNSAGALPAQLLPGETPKLLSPTRLPLVEFTGGESLLQSNSLPLMRLLCDDGFTVLLETSGAHDIAPVD